MAGRTQWFTLASVTLKYQELYSYTAVVVVVVLLILSGWLYLPDGRFTYRSSVQKIKL